MDEKLKGTYIKVDEFEAICFSGIEPYRKIDFAIGGKQMHLDSRCNDMDKIVVLDLEKYTRSIQREVVNLFDRLCHYSNADIKKIFEKDCNTVSDVLKTYPFEEIEKRLNQNDTLKNLKPGDEIEFLLSRYKAKAYKKYKGVLGIVIFIDGQVIRVLEKGCTGTSWIISTDNVVQVIGKHFSMDSLTNYLKPPKEDK